MWHYLDSDHILDFVLVCVCGQQCHGLFSVLTFTYLAYKESFLSNRARVDNSFMMAAVDRENKSKEQLDVPLF